MAKKKPKYTTIAQLAEAFKSGELDKDKHYLMLDKGGMDVSLSVVNEWGDDDKYERESDKVGALCEIEYGEPIEQALTALGIPWEWC